jgi:hypothetical protein
LAYNYIQESDLDTLWQDAEKHMKPLFEPLDELERIARNLPHPGIAKELPKVTDGTTASHVKERPKRIIQQIPTGAVVESSDWMKLVGGHILEKEILPNSDQVAALIKKCWALISKADTYGSQPAFVQFVQRGQYFGTDWTLPYIKDVFLEPGKLSDKDSCVIALRGWYTPRQIDQIIAKEKLLADKNKERGDKYSSDWDLKALASLKDEKSAKPDTAQSPAERNKPDAQGFIELIHFFQEGIGATFFSYSPKTKEVVRRRVNKDPRGVIPIHYMYSDQDFSNPLGRGIIELAAPLQNLIDSEMQSYQYMRSLMLDPPLQKWGLVSKSTIKYRPGAIWDMGATENNKVEPVSLETQSLQQFPQNYGLMKSQLMMLLTGGGGDNSIGADSGNPSFSKTQAGVKAQEARLGTNDNHVRKQFEDCFADITETQLNLWFAERSGIQELTLDKETASKLAKIMPGSVNKSNQIRVDYDQETPRLKFRVDASSSMKKEAAEQLEPLTTLIQQIESSPLLQQLVPPDSIKETWNAIVSASGVENPEKLQIPMEDEQGNPVQPQQQQPQITPEMVQQMVQEAMQADKANDPGEHPLIKLMTTLNIKFTDLDPDTQRFIVQNVLGAPATGQLPSEVNQATQAQDMALKADNQAHQQQMDTAKAHLEAVKTATSAAQLVHTQGQAQHDNQLKGAQFNHSVHTSEQSHALALRKPTGVK